MINRKNFYDQVRDKLFNGKLSQQQVEGMEAILNEWESRDELTDLRWLAYMLATVYHETARTMQPIEEYGKGRGRPYGIKDKRTGKIYYGRGLVQLTWYDNYVKMGLILGIDLKFHPELALDMNIAVKILFEGMTKALSNFGDFTGRSLEHYFTETKEDWYNARRIINGVDRASDVAEYGKIFHKALLTKS